MFGVGALIVEVTPITVYITVGITQNKEVGKTAEQHDLTRKSKLAVKVRKLDTWENDSRPDDNMCLFHANIDEFIESSMTNTQYTIGSEHNF